MIDTHTHLYLPDFEEGGVPAVERALAAGVHHMVFPNVDVATLEPMLGLAAKYPAEIVVGIGLHPTEVFDDWEQSLAKIKQSFDCHDVAAVGEVGIDLYWDKTYRDEQMEVFASQISWAEEHRLPVIVHCREGLEEVLTTLRNHPGELPQIIFHSFTGSADDVKRIREVTDAWFGINGVVTFKNARELREALPEIGIDRIVLETDSPYLAPVPYRGKRNESAYITEVNKCVAAVLGLSPEECERLTDANALGLFFKKGGDV